MDTKNSAFSIMHRVIIVMRFVEHQSHTTDEIMRHLAANGHDMSLRTTQRTLSDLELLGLVLKELKIHEIMEYFPAEYVEQVSAAITKAESTS